MIPAEKQKEFDKLVDYAIRSNSRAWNDLAHYIEYLNVGIPVYHTDFNNAPRLIFSLFRPSKDWDLFEERLILFLNKIWNHTNGFVFYHYDFLGRVICDKKIDILVKCGFSEHDIWLTTHILHDVDIDSPIVNYIIDNADKYLSSISHNFHESWNFIRCLIIKKPELVDKHLDKLMKGVNDGNEVITLHQTLKNYLRINPLKHEDYLINSLSLRSNNYDTIFNLIDLITTNYPKKYQKEIELFAQKQIEFAVNDTKQIACYHFDSFLDLLLIYNSTEDAFKIGFNYLEKFKDDNSKDFLCKFRNYHAENLATLIKKLKQYETAMTSDIVENFWLFARHADKEVRQLTAQHIAKTLGEAAIPEAEKMILEKKTDVRLTGAKILSLIKTEKATNILRGYMDDEINDDVRNAMLEGIAHYLVENATIESVAESVTSAEKRGKLAKPVLAWLVKYPPLTYKKDGIALDDATIAFLFYRMSQAKDIRTDLEARPLLSLIDRETSAPFSKWLLDSYFQNGADAKFKWCLTLGAMLGGDNEVSFLQRNVVSFVDSNRGRMAENVVKALALQGSQRALRAVEFFSRKYKTKNKNIGAAALEAFDMAAEELGMTPYELADSVIPDFGFDGLFKEFEANKDTYRAFIGNDFKLAFLDEDNKTLKALPKGTSAELKEEFKEIGKEIRDIVKSQSSRLEQYLVIQRRWSVDKWQAFFLTNPVMFVYAVRLIWGVFDDKNNLIAVFRCQEDQTLTDKDGDEIDFEALENAQMSLRGIEATEGVSNVGFGMSDVANQSSINNKKLTIGMVHPIGLDAETTDFWKNDLLDNDIEAIFPQLTRSVILLKDMDKNVKMSDDFSGIQFGGYGFISRMDKTGWSRGSVVDGGGISSYYKEFTEVGLVAIVMQTGGLSVGYYDVNAEIGNLMFVKKSGVRFGSYMYDEPSKHDDPRLVRFGDVPPIVYSEVMADMQFFKDNQVKES
jgi:hypothetical protein